MLYILYVRYMLYIVYIVYILYLLCILYIVYILYILYALHIYTIYTVYTITPAVLLRAAVAPADKSTWPSVPMRLMTCVCKPFPSSLSCSKNIDMPDELIVTPPS